MTESDSVNHEHKKLDTGWEISTENAPNFQVESEAEDSNPEFQGQKFGQTI